jgi:molybdopterin synthase catalytic subunit
LTIEQDAGHDTIQIAPNPELCKEKTMIDQWIKEIKERSDFKDLGMFLVHNGVVRASSKDGRPVQGMHLSYDKKKLTDLVNELSKRDGVVSVRVWINEGMLRVGDDIMYALVAGKFRTYVFPVLEELVSRIKKEIVSETENS